MNVSRMLTAVGSCLVIAAVAVAAYPPVATAWGAYRANLQFSEEYAVASQYDQARVDYLIRQAACYNARIAGSDAGVDVDLSEPVAEESLLRYGESQVLCWLDIPSLDVKVPVYRDDGTEEVPLQGAEHVRGTSLPVGGESANTVITAHSGSQAGASMAFNKLDDLACGDLMVLWTLGHPYAYAFTGSELVQPNEAAGLSVSPGSDELTLVTCRPIGTTSQRLVTHAMRVDYQPAQGATRLGPLPNLGDRPAVIAVGVLAIGLFVLLSIAVRKRRE